MESYVIAIIPVFLTAFLGCLGWLVGRMLKLSEAVATVVERAEAINVQQARMDERLDAFIMSQFRG